MRIAAAIIAVVLVAMPAVARADKLVEIESRGQKIRALLIEPAKPVGAVILLAGGHGNLGLGPDGAIGWGRGNQLVRTRALYAAAGFITLVPDIAPDLKDGAGGINRYRFDAPHAQDIGAMVAWLRAKAATVAVVGTSRGSISAASAAVRLSGTQRPDAVVITSPYLHPFDHREGHVRRIAGDDPKRFGAPLFVLVHEKDGCAGTDPSALPGFKTWYETSGRKLTSLALTGGGAGAGDPCEANSPHGFVGLDDRVVEIVTGWVRRR